MAFEQGPYVQVAGFCEKVLTEQDGVNSLIRVIDRVTHTRTGTDAPDSLPPFDYQMLAVIALKSGKVRGRHTLTIERQLPSGEVDKEKPEITIHLEGEGHGASVVVDVIGRFTLEGLHWYNVYFDGALLTRMPFEVRYARLTQSP